MRYTLLLRWACNGVTQDVGDRIQIFNFRVDFLHVRFRANRRVSEQLASILKGLLLIAAIVAQVADFAYRRGLN